MPNGGHGLIHSDPVLLISVTLSLLCQRDVLPPVRTQLTKPYFWTFFTVAHLDGRKGSKHQVVQFEGTTIKE